MRHYWENKSAKLYTAAATTAAAAAAVYKTFGFENKSAREKNEESVSAREWTKQPMDPNASAPIVRMIQLCRELPG